MARGGGGGGGTWFELAHATMHQDIGWGAVGSSRTGGLWVLCTLQCLSSAAFFVLSIAHSLSSSIFHAHTHASPLPPPPLTQVQSTAKDGPDADEDDDKDGALDEVVVTQQVMHVHAKDIANEDLRSDKKPCKPSPYSIWVSCKDLKASQESNVVRWKRGKVEGGAGCGVVAGSSQGGVGEGSMAR